MGDEAQVARLFLQVPPKTILLPAIYNLPGWPSSGVQQKLIQAIDQTIRQYPPSKRWLGSICKDLEANILQFQSNWSKLSPSEAESRVSCETSDSNNGVISQDLSSDLTSTNNPHIQDYDNGKLLDEYEVCEELIELIMFNYSRPDTEEDESFVSFVVDGNMFHFKTLRSHNQVGTKIWGAGIFLIDFFLRLIEDNPWIRSNNLELLELGAGVGITGIVLKKLLPQCSVMLTDFDGGILEIMRENLTVNFSNDSAAERSESDLMDSDARRKIDVKQLDWTLLAQMNDVLISSDVIFAADCVYSEDLQRPLLLTIRNILSRTSQAKRFDQQRMKLGDLDLPLPCAFIASTERNTETYSNFLSCLEELSDDLNYFDATAYVKDVQSRSKLDLYYEFRDLMRVACVYLK